MDKLRQYIVENRDDLDGQALLEVEQRLVALEKKRAKKQKPDDSGIDIIFSLNAELDKERKRVNDLEQIIAEMTKKQTDLQADAELGRLVRMMPGNMDLFHEGEIWCVWFERCKSDSYDTPEKALRAAGIGQGKQEEPWCEPCRSFHPIPRDAQHHAAIRCHAEWKGPEQVWDTKTGMYKGNANLSVMPNQWRCPSCTRFNGIGTVVCSFCQWCSKCGGRTDNDPIHLCKCEQNQEGPV